MEQRIEFRVLSWVAAERYEPRGIEVCISIGDPRAALAQLSPAFVAVLRLAFNDIVVAPAAEDVLFSAEQAGEILRFVEQWPRGASRRQGSPWACATLLAGRSRSSRARSLCGIDGCGV